MSLKKQIKRSGQIYFETHSPDVPLSKTLFTSGVESFNLPVTPLKKKFFTPKMIWSFSTASVVLAGAVVFALVINNTLNGSLGVEALNQVNYPDASIRSSIAVSSDYVVGVGQFMEKTTKELYTDETKSFVYSPLSAYYALSLLLEGASGNTYSQLAELLNVSDLAALRVDSQSVYQNLYYDLLFSNWEGEKEAFSKMGNAIYINNTASVKEEYLTSLANHYFAEAYHTDFGESSKQEIADWLNGMTNGFLDVKLEELTVTPEDLFVLYNTIYMKCSWLQAYKKAANIEGDFTNLGNNEVTNVTYMRKEIDFATYYDTTEYAMAVDKTYGGNKVIYVRPNDGYTPGDILASEYLLNGILGAGVTGPDDRRVDIELPKHSTFSHYSLKDALIVNGVYDVFDMARSDLSKAADNAFVSAIVQDVGIQFDERGMEAASYTEVTNSGAASNGDALPPVYFPLNRSFIYIVLSPESIPLFVGVTNSIE